MGVLRAPLTLTLRSSIWGFISTPWSCLELEGGAELPPLLFLTVEEGASGSYPLAGSRQPCKSPPGLLRMWLPYPGKLSLCSCPLLVPSSLLCILDPASAEQDHKTHLARFLG